MLKKTLAFLFLGSLAYADTGYVPSFVRAAVVINGTTVTVTSGGGYSTVQDEGSDLTQRAKLNFTGAGVSCADNAGDTRTDCTITSGGGGSSSLQVSRSGVEITSPTASINFYSGDFLGTAIGGTTSYMFLNPGTTNYIRNTSSLQSNTTFYTSSGTVNTFNIGTQIRWPDGTIQVSSPPASGSASLTDSQVAFGSGSNTITSTTSFKWNNTPEQYGPQLQVVGNQRIESYKSTAFGNTSSTMTIRATNSNYANSGIVLDSIGPSAFSIMVGTNSEAGLYTTFSIDDPTNASSSCDNGGVSFMNYDYASTGYYVCFNNGNIKASQNITGSTLNTTAFNVTGTSATVTGAGGLRANYGVWASTLTAYNLTNGRILYTSNSNGLIGDSPDMVLHTNNAIVQLSDPSDFYTTTTGYGIKQLISGHGTAPNKLYANHFSLEGTIQGDVYGYYAGIYNDYAATNYGAVLISSGASTNYSLWASAPGGGDNYAVWVDSGQVQINSSATITGAGGMGVTYGLTAGSVTANTTLTLPQGAAPTTSAVGQIAFDTTDGAIIAFDGATEKVIAHSTHSFTVTISSGLGWDGLAIPVWRSPDNMAITINKVLAESLPAGTTVVYQLDERAFGSVNSAGTDVFSIAYSSANNTGVTTTSFSNPGIAANASVVFKTPSANSSGGTPSYATLTVYYTKDRE